MFLEQEKRPWLCQLIPPSLWKRLWVFPSGAETPTVYRHTCRGAQRYERQTSSRRFSATRHVGSTFWDKTFFFLSLTLSLSLFVFSSLSLSLFLSFPFLTVCTMFFPGGHAFPCVVLDARNFQCPKFMAKTCHLALMVWIWGPGLLYPCMHGDFFSCRMKSWKSMEISQP